jgi:hypothetical protein
LIREQALNGRVNLTSTKIVTKESIQMANDSREAHIDPRHGLISADHSLLGEHAPLLGDSNPSVVCNANPGRLLPQIPSSNGSIIGKNMPTENQSSPKRGFQTEVLKGLAFVDEPEFILFKDNVDRKTAGNQRLRRHPLAVILFQGLPEALAKPETSSNFIKANKETLAKLALAYEQYKRSLKLGSGHTEETSTLAERILSQAPSLELSATHQMALAPMPEVPVLRKLPPEADATPPNLASDHAEPPANHTRNISDHDYRMVSSYFAPLSQEIASGWLHNLDFIFKDARFTVAAPPVSQKNRLKLQINYVPTQHKAANYVLELLLTTVDGEITLSTQTAMNEQSLSAFQTSKAISCNPVMITYAWYASIQRILTIEGQPRSEECT